jgi:hypothetical protein
MAAKTLPIEQMYRVLRGLPGTISLVGPAAETYRLTVVNPNAPANRCQETLGLAVTLDGPLDTAVPSRSVTRSFTQDELDILRSGASVVLDLDGVQVRIQSNPGGQMVMLEDEDEPAFDG